MYLQVKLNALKINISKEKMSPVFQSLTNQTMHIWGELEIQLGRG